MTLDQIIPPYLKLRQELIARGESFKDWTVSLSPESACDLQLERKNEVGAGERMYGAVWVTDARVPPGEVWLTIRGERKHVIKVAA